MRMFPAILSSLILAAAFADKVLGPADKSFVRYITGPRPEF